MGELVIMLGQPVNDGSGSWAVYKNVGGLSCMIFNHR